MDSYDIKRLALILAVQAEIEGMKADNLQDTSRNMEPRWNGLFFIKRGEDLKTFAYTHNEQL